jgi:hypothetical protein
MTPTNVQEQIREQLAALRRTTDKATESKEAALKYLEEAGISTKKKVSKFEKKSKK